MEMGEKHLIEDVKDFLYEHRKALIFGAIGLFIVIVLIRFIFGIVSAASQSYEPVQRKHMKALTNDPEMKKNMSILLLGLDKKDGGAQRADSIILVMYDAYHNKAKTVRIPRDLYVEKGDYKGKINGLYDAQGTEGLIEEVSKYTGVPITNYAKTDFSGLSGIVDSVGGVDVDSDIEINKSNNKEVGKDITVDKGHVHLNGKEALAYSRIRYIDNDIKRGERQQQVIKAIADKLTSPTELPILDQNLQSLSQYVKTDIRMRDVLPRMKLISDRPDVSSESFEWSSFDYKGGSYVMLTEKERQKLSDEMRQSVGLQKKQLEPMTLKPEGAK